MVSTTTKIGDNLLTMGCDLLENIYLCGINNNKLHLHAPLWNVVICLKISTFVVSTTTFFSDFLLTVGCDLLENIYLCGINNNHNREEV